MINRRVIIILKGLGGINIFNQNTIKVIDEIKFFNF